MSRSVFTQSNANAQLRNLLVVLHGYTKTPAKCNITSGIRAAFESYTAICSL